MKFENTEVMNFEGAFRGLRNPLNSWKRSDSAFGVCEIYGDEGSEVIGAWMSKKFPDEPSDGWTYSDEYWEEEDRIANWLDRNAVLHFDNKVLVILNMHRLLIILLGLFLVFFSFLPPLFFFIIT